MVESIWVSNHLSKPVVKVYNSILAGSLIQSGVPKDSTSRIALPISGDNIQKKQIVATLVNDSGFDSLDIGDLATSWRQQPGSPVYCTDLSLSHLKLNIDKIQKHSLHEKRELALQFILQQNPALELDWWKNCITNNRIIYETDLNE